jgi:hypothetical protein
MGREVFWFIKEGVFLNDQNYVVCWSIQKAELNHPLRSAGCAACWLASKIRVPLKTEELFKELLVEFALK